MSGYKTVEVKLDLTKHQQTLIDDWLDKLVWIWNEGLRLLIEWKTFKYYELLEKDLPPEEFAQVERRSLTLQEKPYITKIYHFTKSGKPYRPDRVYYYPSKSGKKGKKLAETLNETDITTEVLPESFAIGATCPIGFGKGDNYRQICSLPLPNQPKLKGYNFVTISKRDYSHRPEVLSVPSSFTKGGMAQLSDAWKAYENSKLFNRNLPKFKSRREGFDTLYTKDSSEIKIINGKLCLPGIKKLGLLKSVNKQLSKRWIYGCAIKTAKITRKASGYYLQLTGELPVKKIKSSDRACGIDLGLQYIYSDDNQKEIKPPKYYRKQEEQLNKLQKKLARQRRLNPQGSKNMVKTRKKLARVHEKIAARRKNFNHKISTYLVRTYGAIACEDIKLTNLMRRPKLKIAKTGDSFLPNNAKAKAGLNKSFADAGLGQLRTFIEQKAKHCDREFVKVPPHYTSQECPECRRLGIVNADGSRVIVKKSLSQRTHECNACGCILPRDRAAAINILDKGMALFTRTYHIRQKVIVNTQEEIVINTAPPPVEENFVNVTLVLTAPTTIKKPCMTVRKPHRHTATKSTVTETVKQFTLDLWGM